MKQLTNEQVTNVSGGEPRGEDGDGRQLDGSDIGDITVRKDRIDIAYHKPDGSNDGGQSFYFDVP